MKIIFAVLFMVLAYAATIASASLPNSQPMALQTYRCLNSKVLLLTNNGRSVRIALAGRELLLLWQTPNRASNASFEWRQGSSAALYRVSSNLPVVQQCYLTKI